MDGEEQSGRLHREVPASELLVVPGFGHMVHHGEPALVADAIKVMAATGQGVPVT